MNISELLGKTLTEVRNIDNERIEFTTSEGNRYALLHNQDCCESVTVEDICGDLDDLVGLPILQAEEATSNTNPHGVAAKEYEDSFTWTFYRLATNKGSVVIRWYGSSNGYYSESVEFEEVT